MNALSFLAAGVAAAIFPPDETRTSEPAGQETPPAIVPAGPDPVYPADFYKPFQPQTALDMLERTPGFLLSEGTSVRGFGGGAGNVLIDGQRPTVKGGGITEVLRRIAASRVERIVLLRGSDAAEAQGQTLVANVVLRVDAGGSGNVSATFSHTSDGFVSPSVRASHARRIAGWQTSIELSGEVTRYPDEGIYFDRDAAGNLSSTRKESISAKAPEYGLALSTSGALGGGTLTVNLRLNKEGYSSDRAIDIFAAADETPESRRDIAYDEKGRSGELGLDWTRRIGSGWTTKLVGLGRPSASPPTRITWKRTIAGCPRRSRNRWNWSDAAPSRVRAITRYARNSVPKWLTTAFPACSTTQRIPAVGWSRCPWPMRPPAFPNCAAKPSPTSPSSSPASSILKRE
nr:TonB-dependent receptor [Novosphingobium sp. ST904]